MDLFAAIAEYCAAPVCRLGPPALRWRRCPRRTASRGPGEYAGDGQARPGAVRPVARTVAGHSAARGTRVEVSTRGIATPSIVGADCLGDGRCADSTCCVGG